MRVWAESDILAALDTFGRQGEATVTCESPSSARRFRTAIYNFLRRRGTMLEPQIRVAGVDVILLRAPPPESVEVH